VRCGLALACLAFAACSTAVRFNTELSSPDGLASGNPVTNQGATIGSVRSVSPLPDGNSAVAFEVARSFADQIKQDSIMVLRDSGAPRLDVLNPKPESPPAAPGATLEGASSQGEADLLMAGSGLASFTTGVAAILGAIGYNIPSLGSTPSLNLPPAYGAWAQQLSALQNWYAAYSASNAANAADRLQQLNGSVASLERQLIRQGKSAQAERLRQELQRFASGLKHLPPP